MYNKDGKKMTEKEVKTHLLKEAIGSIIIQIIPTSYKVKYYDNNGNRITEDKDSKVFSYEQYYMGQDGKEQYFIEFKVDFKNNEFKFQDKNRVAEAMLKAIENDYKGE